MATRIAGVVFAATLVLFAAWNGDAQQQPSTTPPTFAQPSAPALVIGSGDLIGVEMFDSPELSGHFRVDQNGDVDLPLLGPVHVQGLTAVQAGTLIQNRYVQAQILSPEASHANVYIEEYANQGITVSGEVKTPGIYPAFGVRKLNDVVTAAGGITQLSASKVIITRRNDPEHPVTVDYNPQALTPIVPDVQIYPGDTVLIPRAGIVYVLGDVNKAGGYVLDGRNTLTAERAMALAGGEGRFAALKKAQLVRTLQGGRKEMITVPLDLIYKGKSPDVALQDGDILYVPLSEGKLWTTQAITSAITIASQVTIYKTALQ
jgi:polysaccharide biosynthesis/export protein